jgi:hypothetical protein
MEGQQHDWNVTTDETGSESVECPQKVEYSDVIQARELEREKSLKAKGEKCLLVEFSYRKNRRNPNYCVLTKISQTSSLIWH